MVLEREICTAIAFTVVQMHARESSGDRMAPGDE